MSIWANKRVKKLLRVQYYKVMILLETEIKTELRCNVYDDVIIKERCCI